MKKRFALLGLYFVLTTAVICPFHEDDAVCVGNHPPATSTVSNKMPLVEQPRDHLLEPVAEGLASQI